MMATTNDTCHFSDDMDTLTVTNGIGRFDAEAIQQTKVRRMVKELLRRVSELKQDKHRL
jgi:hypothetical protein